MSTFDDRIVKLVFTYGATQITIDTSLNPQNPPMITANGSKNILPTQNECTIQIANLATPLRQALATNLTQYSPLPEVRKTVEVWAGRVSTGYFLKFVGDIIVATPSQPPDIVLTIKAKTCQFYKNDILAQSYAVVAPTSQIAGDVAKSMGLKLNFAATDRQIANYSYTGSAEKQIGHLADTGSIDAYIDDGTLVCKNRGQPLANVSWVLSKDNGMIGQIEPTEYGIRVRSMLSPEVRLGGQINVSSVLNPSLNGAYTVYRAGFEIATRDTPFYDIIEATRYATFLYDSTGAGLS